MARLFHHGDGSAFYFIAWSRDGAVAGRSLHAPVDVPRPERPDGAQSRTYRRKREGYREAYQFTDAGDCVLAGRSRAADLEAMARFKAWLFVAGGGVLATGLGLAICKSIIDAAGGTVDVSSQPGAGTTVTVRLPGAVRRCS